MRRRKLLGLMMGGAAAFGGTVVIDHRNSSAGGPEQAAPALGGDDEPSPTSSPSATPTQPASDDDSASPGGSTLVVYFSRPGENYPNLDLAIGNTAQVAGFIHDRTGGDLFEIVPVQTYPASYDETTEVAQQELDDQTFRDITGDSPDVARYATVFVGYPIWWGEPPMVVQTYLRDHDLSHATIVPFSTHEGSGFGNSLDVLTRRYPRATLADGFTERGRTVADDPEGTRGAVDRWLEDLGF